MQIKSVSGLSRSWKLLDKLQAPRCPLHLCLMTKWRVSVKLSLLVNSRKCLYYIVLSINRKPRFSPAQMKRRTPQYMMRWVCLLLQTQATLIEYIAFSNILLFVLSCPVPLHEYITPASFLGFGGSDIITETVINNTTRNKNNSDVKIWCYDHHHHCCHYHTLSLSFRSFLKGCVWIFCLSFWFWIFLFQGLGWFLDVPAPLYDIHVMQTPSSCFSFGGEGSQNL